MPRPNKKLTQKDLLEIEMLAGLGLNQQQIADVKGMCVDTLRKNAIKHYKGGKSKAIAQVAKTAYEMAVSGKYQAMTMFYLKTQARWSEHLPIPEELFRILKMNREVSDHGD